MMSEQDYRYTQDKKIRRQYISNSIIIDGLYERSARLHTKPYGNDTYWEEINHLYEEINYYKTEFNNIILKSSIVDKIENGGIEHTGNGECYCIDCIINEKIENIVENQTIKTLNGNTYNQVFKSDKPYIIKKKDKYYNVVSSRNSILNKEMPITEFIDTIY